MKYDLTVICPGIRVGNWQRLYESIAKSFFGTWQIVFVGPYPPPDDLRAMENVKFIQDFGSPIRCQQIGLTFADGEWITWAADDGYFLENSLTVGWSKLVEQDMNPRCVVMGKYYEGNNDGDMPMQENKYYVLSNHDASRSSFIPKEYFMLNVGLVSKKILFELGGWDCCFEVCPMSYNDLAIRLQRHGCPFIIQDEMMFTCSHLPGHAGDHGPIHDAQVYHDQPLFMDIYSRPECVNRVAIPIDNWNMAPDVWTRRFPSNIKENLK